MLSFGILRCWPGDSWRSSTEPASLGGLGVQSSHIQVSWLND